MAAVVAALHAEHTGSCPAGALLCDGGDKCTHHSPKPPSSPRLSPTWSPRPKDSSNRDDESAMSFLREGDGGVDGLEDGGQDGDKEVIQELYHKVKKSKAHIDNYLALLAFVLLTALYLTILYLQADSFKTFEVSTAHMSLLPEGLTGEGGFTFPTTAAIYDWLNDSIVQEIWEDSNCGNGICERPDEFQAFGRFGCPSDCGFSSNLSEIIITLSLSFASEDDMLQSNWNLCLEYPTFLCWYEEPVVFDTLLGTNVVDLFVPDGNWTLRVNAPFGGVVGSVVYNSTYAWEAPDAIGLGEALLSWSNCAANESETSLELCRQVAGALTQCAAQFCAISGEPLASPAASTALFVDLVGLCNVDSESLNDFADMDCVEAANELTQNSTDAFKNIMCTVSDDELAPSEAPTADPPEPSRRLLQDSASWSFPAYSRGVSRQPDADSTFTLPERRKTLAELNTQPSQFTSTLWSKLGSTQSQRLYNLQAATQRAVYSWTGHSCLAGTAKPLTSVSKISAFFCTYFGGPSYLEECAYQSSSNSSSSSSNDILTTDNAIASAMKAIHAGLSITREQEDAFVNVFLLALQSVHTFDESTLVAFRDRLHALDTEIVDPTKEGCPHVASRLPWSVGQRHYSEVQVGDSITWVWEDDEPHSIKVEDGLGDGNKGGMFEGMGAGRLIVSRQTVCAATNIGSVNLSRDPMPCVLQEPSSTFNSFSYTKVFDDVGTVTYTDGRNELTGGVVKVTNMSIRSRLSIGSLANECSPGCTLGVVRNGICNTACNNLECAFDGGDCSCSPNEDGISICSCPEGQARNTDGSCCEAYGVGTDLHFPFQILTWGPNVTVTDANFLPKDGPPLFRYIASHNRVLVGMAIKQTRWASKPCKDGRFFDLFPNCTYSTSKANYGVNPVFLPKSVLYNPDFARNDTSYYGNHSLGFNNDTLRNQQGIPYGFEAFSYEGSRPTFHYILDINFNNEQAEESLRYMRDGFFMDNATKDVTVQLITYNGVAHKFTLFEVLLTFQTGGKIAATYNIQSVTAEPYSSALDWFRLALEIIFVCCVCWNIFEEFKELWETRKREGSVLAHFTHLWNIVDFVSLGIMISGIALWTNFVLTQAQPFKIQLRYDIYDIVAWQSPGQYWNIVPPGGGFADALAAFSDVEAMVFFKTYYVALQGINVLLMVLRILKLMDFQPRMGTITRTVAAAAPDLVHFFILFFVVFFGFAMYGHLVFGRTLDQFRTLPIALVTCFSAMLGNDSTNDFLMQLQGWELVAAVLFWWSYILIMVFIIFNLLIAIVVEAFMKVREDMEEAPSMPSEVLWIARHMGRRMFTPLKTDKQLLRHLRALGADKAVEIAKYGYEYGEERSASASKGGQVAESPASQQVLRVDNREIDAETLEAIFERAERRKVETKVKIKRHVDPKVIADIIFNQFGEEPHHSEIQGRSETEELIHNVETMKRDMAEMKAMMVGMVAAISNINNQSQGT